MAQVWTSIQINILYTAARSDRAEGDRNDEALTSSSLRILCFRRQPINQAVGMVLEKSATVSQCSGRQNRRFRAALPGWKASSAAASVLRHYSELVGNEGNPLERPPKRSGDLDTAGRVRCLAITGVLRTTDLHFSAFKNMYFNDGALSRKMAITGSPGAREQRAERTISGHRLETTWKMSRRWWHIQPEAAVVGYSTQLLKVRAIYATYVTGRNRHQNFIPWKSALAN